MKTLLRMSVNALPNRSRYWIRHIPGLSLFQRWLIRCALYGDRFVHKINAGPACGLKFEVTLPEDKAIWAGTFEPEFSQALHNAVSKGDVCYDIGGYRGFISGVLALSGASRVIVFEPLPENIAALKRLAELNPSLPIQIEQKAVGKVDGKIGFKVMPDQSMGKLADSTFQAERAPSREILVHLVCLDTCIFEHGLPKPNVIKIDVEGAEAEVLEGAKRTLKECSPVILIEAHSGQLAESCARELRDHSYKVCQLEKGSLPESQPRHLFAYPRKV
jgi:FkbM family methyltransferase